MKTLLQAFTKHPSTVGETYLQHMSASLSFAFPMLLASLAAVIHAIFPFLCVKTGSNSITRLHERMVVNRNRMPPSQH